MAIATKTKSTPSTITRSKLSHQQALVAITEVILQHGNIDDLIPQLIETVQRVMQVDNVAILRLDAGGTVLVMDTVRGPEAAVANQVQVPVGQGVAGRIVASGEPLIIPDLSKAEVVNSFLSQHLHSLLGVPLRVADRSLGVIHVSTTRKRTFTKSDMRLLQLVADRIALALDRLTMVQNAQAAQALAEERAGQLEAIFASMTDGVFVMDRAGRVLQSNAAGARLLQFTELPEYYRAPMGERAPRTAVMDRGGTTLPEQEWPFARILRGEVLSGSHAQDLRLDLHTGKSVIVSVAGAPVRDAWGYIVAAVCICREVTERRALEQQKQEMLDAILAMASILVGTDAIAEDVAQKLIGLACDILSCQRAALSVIDPETEWVTPFAVAGLSAEQAERWWAVQRAHQVSLADMPDQDFVAAMRAGQVKSYDFTQAPDAHLPNPYGILTMLLAPLLVDGELIGFLALDHGDDYHAYSPAEEQLAAAVAHLIGLVIEHERLLRERASSQAHTLALEETMQRMQTFLGITSHELRSPLTTIKANTQMVARAARKSLDRDDISEPLQEQMSRALQLLESVNRQADHMNRVIADLLDTTRIQAGKLELHISLQDITGLVQEAVGMQQMSWHKRTIELESPEGALVVRCDPDRISQVLTNLITNAVKYSPPTCPVRVRVVHEPQQVRVDVIDQGPGLTSEQQEHLFDAFVQAEGIRQHAESQASQAGVGLGLFICQAIVRQHGGEIGVESDVGSGSTFWFALPLTPEP